MGFYTIQNGEILIANNQGALTRFYDNVLPLPNDYQKDKYIVINNQLVLNPEWNDIELNIAKSNKIIENDSVRDAVLDAGVIYKEILFDSDTDQKVNLLAIVSTMSDEDTIVWFGKDNQPLECTKEDLFNIGNLITLLDNFCWTKNAEVKSLINLAETVEEVNAIEIDYTMPKPEPEPEDEETEETPEEEGE